MDIISLDQKRREAEAAAAPDYVACPCGGAWFELRGGAVCMTPAGSITGWTGKPHCRSCGRLYTKSSPRG